MGGKPKAIARRLFQEALIAGTDTDDLRVEEGPTPGPALPPPPIPAPTTGTLP